MKHFKLKIGAILLGTVCAFISCTSLEEQPQSFFPANNFYKTAADANAAVTAVYYFLNAGGTQTQTPYNSLFSTGMEMMTDDIDPGPGATNADVRSQAQFGQNSSGLRILQIWQQHYTGIARANLAIDNIPATSATAAQKAEYIAEASGLRALYYFNLVRLYGDVPLVIHNSLNLDISSLQVSRTPSAQVYNQIIKDFTTAIDSLPYVQTGANLGRFSGGAAQALLSKVYLTQQNWALAVQTSEKVINSGQFSLYPNYTDLFNVAKKNGSELIFSAQFLSNIQAQSNVMATRGMASSFGNQGLPGGSYADQVRYYTHNGDPYYSVYKMYTPGDKRLSVDANGNGAFRRFFTNPSTGKKLVTYNVNPTTVNGVAIPGDTTAFLNKYWDYTVPGNEPQSGANVPIIRYAEVLLIAAEAENELNGPTANAYNYINQVRARAGLAPLAGLTQSSFRDAVYLERRLELVWEYQRWFDLIREYGGPNGTSGPTGIPYLIYATHLVGKSNSQPKHYLYPIPLQEIQLNPNLTQNPGW